MNNKLVFIKKILLLLVMFVVAGVFFLFINPMNDCVSIKPLDSGEHEHIFDRKVIASEFLKENEDEYSIYYYSCVCGEKGTETFEYKETSENGFHLLHKYDQQIVSKEHLCSMATCSSKAIYYFSCECGKNGNKTFEYGGYASHVYNQKIISNEYLKSEATCLSPATYYYSCECGEKGATFFEYGNAINHEYILVDSIKTPSNEEEGAHLKKCVHCGHEKKEEVKKIDADKYKIVDYVDMVDGSFLDTGIIANSNSRIYVELSTDGIGNGDCYFYGSGDESDAFEAYVWDGGIEVNYGPESEEINVSIAKDKHFIIDENKNIISIYDDDRFLFKKEGEKHKFDTGNSIYLNALNRYDDVVTSKAGVKYYNVRIYSNGVLKMELIPILNLDKAEVGFFDTITETYLGNSSEIGYFSDGHSYNSRVIKKPTNTEDGIIAYFCEDCEFEYTRSIPKFSDTDYTLVDYIDSEGKQYLLTNHEIGPNNKTGELYIDFDFDDSTNNWAGAAWYLEFNYSCFNSDNRFKGKIYYDNGKVFYYKDDQLETTKDWTNAVRNDDVSISYYRQHDINGWYNEYDNHPIDGKIYESYIKIDNILKAHYLPVMQNDGTYGLYDIVHKDFVPFIGTGDYTESYHFWKIENVRLPSSTKKGLIKFTCEKCGCTHKEETSTIDETKYQFMDCFESDGRQYTDTGIYITDSDNYTVNLDLELDKLGYTWSLANYYLQVSSDIIGDTNRNSIVARFFSNRESVYKNATRIYTNDYGLLNGGKTFSLYLMNLGNEPDVLWKNGNKVEGMSGKLYSAQILENNNTLVRNMLPVKNLQTGEIGFYDTVTKVFYPNIGSATNQHLNGQVIKQPTLSSAGIIKYKGSGSDFSYEKTIPELDSSLYEAIPYVDIKNNNNYFINTGINKGSHITKLSAEFDSLDYNDAKILFGAHDDNVGFHYDCLEEDDTTLATYCFGCDDNLDNYLIIDSKIPMEPRHYKTSLEHDGNHIKYTVNGKDTIIDGTIPDLDSNFYLFANNNNNIPENYFSCRLYSFVIEVDNMLERNYIPVIKKDTNEEGLYDSVTDEFYSLSKQQASIDDYTLLDYLKLNGLDAIDTGVYYEGTWTIDIEPSTTRKKQEMNYLGIPGFGIEDGMYFCGEITDVPATTNRQMMTFNFNRINEELFIDDKYVGEAPTGIPYNSFNIVKIGNNINSFVGKLYGMTFSINDEIVYDYKPAVRNSDGAIGLYETCENKFYTSDDYPNVSVDELFFADNTSYNPKIANYTVGFCADIYEEKFENVFYEDLACLDRFELPKKDALNIDTSDYILYGKHYIHNEEMYNLYFLVISGTAHDTVWISNTDVGDGTSGFHKGFEAAADFVLNRIEPFLNDDTDHNKIIITGHSRGAAVSSIINAKLMEKGNHFKKDNIYTYAYACPKYSLRNVSYDNLFIINNKADIITKIPFEKWGYHYEASEIILPFDSETINKMNDYIYENEDYNENSYKGFDDDSTLLMYLETLVPNISLLTDKENREVLAEVAQIMVGMPIDTSPIGILKKARLLVSLNGSIDFKIELIKYLIQNGNKVANSHISYVYQAWVKAMNDVHYYD